MTALTLPISFKSSKFTNASGVGEYATAGLTDGEIAVVWADEGTSGGTSNNVAVQLFTSTGVAVSGEIFPVLIGGNKIS